MNILYIHGLDSSPNSERIGWLKAQGHSVSALHIDYRTEPNTYQRLLDLAREQEIDYIVGSSLGGRLGFWISEELGLSCLLFNPALALEIPGLDDPQPALLRCVARYIVLGAQDDVVDPHQTWDYLNKADREDTIQRVALFQHLGHQIDMETYVESCRWAGLEV